MDDLFVAPGARGTGAVDVLIEAVRAVGAGRGWSVIRWITAENNYRGAEACMIGSRPEQTG